MKKVFSVFIVVFLIAGIFAFSNAEDAYYKELEQINQLKSPDNFVAAGRIYLVGDEIPYDDLLFVVHNWHVQEQVAKRLDLQISREELDQMVHCFHPAPHIITIAIVSENSAVEAKMLSDTYLQVIREFIAAIMDMREPNIFEESRQY